MAEEKSILPAPIKNFLDKFTPTQRIFLGVVIVLTTAGIFLAVNLASSFTYGVLYTNLSMKDSGRIIEQLKTRKIPYEISADGGVIKVPDNQVAELRIELAAEGLPEGGGIGFEIFDKTDAFSTTDFQQNINYLRAVEGELARSIMKLKEVSTAKVHITKPKKSVFIEEQEPAKASIVLKLKPGARVGGNIIPAILHLTAQAVEGLRPENIAIIDVYGSLLSKPDDGTDVSGINDKQLAYQKKMERSFSKKIIDLLEPIVGPGKVRANVKLTLDFNREESTEKIVDPEGIAKVSEKTATKKSQGGVVAGGVPGVSSNVAAAGAGTNAAASNTPASSKSEDSLVNYDVSNKVIHLKKPVGEVQKLSAAVVVDDLVNVQVVDDKLQKETQKRSPEDLAALKRIVQAAVGYNPARGDVVEVVNLSFDRAMATESDFLEDKEATKAFIYEIARYLIYAFIIGLIFFKIIKPIYKKSVEILKELGSPKHEEIEIPKIDGERMAALREARDDAEIERELLEQYKIPKSSKKMGIIKEKVIEFAEENVDGTASLIKTFLVEE